MSIFLRALWRPFGRSLEPSPDYAAHIYWHFFGIREDNTMGRWAVRFELARRTWQTVNFPVNEGVRVGGKWVKAELDPAFANAFIPDKPMVYGSTYLAILKPRLSKEDIAFASRLAIEAARR